ncbi:MAG: hypothetical protein M1821_000710 [Bathelium mastoideum]|nr:MAG: hypothetical protein M1821_000710 [Bathelium mastoideum]
MSRSLSNLPPTSSHTTPPSKPPPTPTPQPTFLTNGSLLRLLFLLEALATLPLALLLLLSPTTALQTLVPAPHIVTTASASLCQWLGALLLGFIPPLLLGALPAGTTTNNTPAQIARRKTVYLVLACEEAALGLVLLGQAVVLGRESGLAAWKLGVGAVMMGMFSGLRVWVLGWREEWFGKEDGVEGRREKKVQ